MADDETPIDTNCEELDNLLECSDSLLSQFVSVCSCEVAKRIGHKALLRICVETGQTCAFDSLTVDGVTCGGDAKIAKLLNIVKCMQQICRDEIKTEHIRVRTPKRSVFNRGCRGY